MKTLNKKLIKHLFSLTMIFAMSSTVVHAEWQKTTASGMRDVSIAPDGKPWLVGQNGTIWYGSWQAGNLGFTQIPASNFSRIAVAPDNVVWAVGYNGTVWKYAGGVWTMAPMAGVTADGLNGMIDVDVDPDGTIWFVRSNFCSPAYITCSSSTKGSIWYSNDQGNHVTRVTSSGFCRISSGYKSTVGVWAVGCNGTVWKYLAGSWTQTLASGMADVAAHGLQGRIDLAGLNGTIWSTYDGVHFNPNAATGFASIANSDYSTDQKWAVGYNGTLWHESYPILH